MWVYYVANFDVVHNNTVFNENLAGSEYFTGMNAWGGNVYYSLGAFGTGNGGGLVNGGWSGTTGVPNSWVMGISSGTNTPNSTKKAIYKDGAVLLSNTNNDNSVTGNNRPFYIGGRWQEANNYYMDGQLAELIVYDGVPSILEQEQIQSYFAIKYGFQKASADNTTSVGQDERDYFASNGSVIWDYSANTGYTTEVTAIGRDDSSALNQPKSKNIAAGSDITMDKAGTFPNNLDFIFWATNNAANGTDNANVPAPFVKRLNRLWKTTVSGAPGAVNISIDLDQLGLPLNLANTEYALLIDSDTDFSSGATIHSTGASLSGTILSFTGVTFADSNFFTVAIKGGSYTGPVGIDRNIKLWLKADAGVTGSTPVSAWADQSGNGFTATVPANGPDLLNNQINFNPVLDFNRSESDYLQITNGILGASTYSDMWVYYVANFDLTNNTVFNENLVGGEYFANLNNWGNQTQYYFGNTSSGNGGGLVNGTWGGTAGVPNSWVMGISSGTNTPNSTKKAIYRNGAVILSNTNNDNSVTGNNQPFYIGGRWTGALGNHMDGQLAELIVYDGVPSILEQEQIQSYFAIKYGFQKASADNTTSVGQDERDYFASNGSVIWDYSANTGYTTEVTAIGRDDSSALNQPKSKNIAAGSDITMDKAGTFPNNLDFIFWATNNAANGSSSNVPTTFTKRLKRIWKTTVSGSPGAVNLSIDMNQLGLSTSLLDSEYALLIDTDEDFSNATIHTTGVSMSSGILTFTNVTFSNANYFTVAAKSSAFNGPGNVDLEVKLWLKADEGITGIDPITTWRDLSGNGFDMSVPGNGPNLLANQLNSNPTVNFTSANSEYMRVTNGIFGTDTHNDMWVYVVSKTDFNQAQTIFFESLAGGEYFDALIPWNNQNIYFDLGNAGAGRINGNWGSNFGDFNYWTLGTSTTTTTPNSTRKTIYKNGSVILSNNNNDNGTGNNQHFLLGSGYNNGNGTTNNFDGQIAELIIYTAVPTIQEQEKIQSYLSLKYGIPKENIDHLSTIEDERDYFASDGSIIWDYSDSTQYNNDIIGIIRDNESNFIQKQSSSRDDSIRIFVDSFAPSNSENLGNITNDVSSIMIGHNTGRLRGDETLSKPETGVFSRFERVWKITNTNFTDKFSLEIEWDSVGDFDINDIIILVDDNGDFSNATIFNSSNGLTFTLGSIIVSGIDTSHIPKDSTRFITIGSISPDTPLPIELISFNAEITPNKYVQLTWKTAIEINNEYFTIERSIDLINWSSISIVKGANNSSETLSYSAEDIRPLDGVSYYRLKQTDYDGKYSYSRIVSINMGSIEETNVVLYPNPATSILTVKGNPLELLSYSIYNVLGVEISSSVTLLEKSDTTFKIDISQLPAGVYVIKTKSLVNTFIKE